MQLVSFLSAVRLLFSPLLAAVLPETAVLLADAVNSERCDTFSNPPSESIHYSHRLFH